MARPGQVAKRRKYKANKQSNSNNSSAISNGNTTRSECSGNQDVEVDTVANHDAGIDDEDDYDDEVGGDGSRTYGRVLPVAELPDDFDGIPEDGATYLALVNRESSALPSFKRVPTALDRTGDPSTSTNSKSQAGPEINPASLTTQLPAPRPPSSRHPALPQDSWQVLFEAHFLSFRKHLASNRAPDNEDEEEKPQGVPRAALRSAWWEYINGKKRPSSHSRRGQLTNGSSRSSNDNSESNGAEMGENRKDEEEEDMELDVEQDEEEAINSAAHPVAAAATKASTSTAASASRQMLNDFGTPRPVEVYEVGNPHEPDSRVIQSLNSNEAFAIITHIAEWIAESIRNLPPNPCTLMPSHPSIRPVYNTRKRRIRIQRQKQADSTVVSSEGNDQDRINGTNQPDANHKNHDENLKENDDDSDDDSDEETKPPPLPNPLPALWSRWLFSLLITLDPGLDSSQISILRDLARSCAKVARWRWEYALSYDELEFHDLDEPNSIIPPSTSCLAERTTIALKPRTRRMGHRIGTKWKTIRDSLPKSTPAPRPESAEANGEKEEGDGKRERGLDETIARCWLVAYCVVAGWAQRDLNDEFERMFRRVGTGIVSVPA